MAAIGLELFAASVIRHKTAALLPFLPALFAASVIRHAGTGAPLTLPTASFHPRQTTSRTIAQGPIPA